MRTIAVAVHAQSLHHVERKVGGWYDTGLTASGRQQAAKMAAALTIDFHSGPVTVISSDLRRASETAEIISSTFSSGVAMDVRLREMSYGVAEGRPQRWLQERTQNRLPGADPLDHRICEGAETRRELATRVYAALGDALARHPGDVIFVTHGFAATFLISAWIGLAIADAGRVHFTTRTASITLLREDDRFANRSVAVLNDTSHLDGV